MDLEIPTKAAEQCSAPPREELKLLPSQPFYTTSGQHDYAQASAYLASTSLTHNSTLIGTCLGILYYT